MCCGGDNGPKWKREVVKDHKFDYVDIDEFYDPSCTTRVSYALMFLGVVKSFLVYVADLWTAVSLLVIGNSSLNADASIPPDVSKWIFFGAIMISFILFFWDVYKATGILKSRDIAYAFTSSIPNCWLSANDYKYFCLFRKINSSKKSIDKVAFFVYFTLKNWKRLLLAEAPRQIINIVTLISIIPKWIQINSGVQLTQNGLGKNTIQRIMTGTMIFSVLIFTISFILVCVAAVIYIPLLCHIQGNLKEYCCHKVDKRIEDLLRKQAKKRIEKNGNPQQQKSYKSGRKKDAIEMESLPTPTLPNVGLEAAATKNYNEYHQYNGSPYYPPSPAPQHQYSSNSLRPAYYNQQTMTSTNSSNYPPYTNNSSFMEVPYGRRDSQSSLGSDQVRLTSHAQGQPLSSPNYPPYHNNNDVYDNYNGSNSNFSSVPQQHQPSYSQQYSYNNYQD